MKRSFTLPTLFASISLAAVVFAYLERRTRDEVFVRRRATQLVPEAESLVAGKLHVWLSELGFRPIESPPPLIQSFDLFGDPYHNFYVGSFQGSKEIYVSANPNWQGAERGPESAFSNVHIYAARRFPARVWEVQPEEAKLEAFFQEFHRWCNEFGPLP